MSIFDSLFGTAPKKAVTPSDLGLGSGGFSAVMAQPKATLSLPSGEGSNILSRSTPPPAIPALKMLQQGTKPKVAPKETQPLTRAVGPGLKLLQQMPSGGAATELEAKDTLGGIVRPEIAETQNRHVIAEAAAAEARKILHSEYQTPKESGLPGWLHKPISRAMQFESAGATYVGDTMQGALRLAGVRGKLVEPVTPQQKLERIYKYLDENNPGLAMQVRSEQALSDYSPVAQGLGTAAGAFSQAGVVSMGTTKLLGAVPAFNALSAGSHGVKGIYAANALYNVAGGIASQTVHGGTREYTVEQIAKNILSSPSMLFGHISIPALGFGAVADYFAGSSLGMSPGQAFLHTALNLGSNYAGHVGLKQQINDFDLDMAKMRSAYHMSDEFENLPSSLKQEVFNSAQRAYAYTKGNPTDFDGNNKIYISEMKRLAPLFKRYMQQSPTGEARLIGLTGPTQSEGGGGILPPPKPTGGSPADGVSPTAKAEVELAAKFFNTTPEDFLKVVRSAGNDVTAIENMVKKVYGKSYPVNENASLADIDAAENWRIAAQATDPASIMQSLTSKPAQAPLGSILPRGVTAPLQADIYGGSATPEAIAGTQAKEAEALTLKSMLAEKQQAIQGGSVQEGQTSIPVEGEQQDFFSQITGGAQPVPSSVPSVPESVPLQTSDARRIGLDLYNQLNAEAGELATSRADLGPEYEAAEGNVGVLMELVRDSQLRGALQRLTGKAGYAALEGVEIQEVGSLVRKLRDQAEQGSDVLRKLNDLEKAVSDGADPDHGQRTLQNAIARARGEETKVRAVPRSDELVEALDTAVRTGRLQLTDELSPGVTVEDVYQSLYSDVAAKSDAKVAAAPKTLLGDVLQRQDARAIKRQTLTKQQLADARLESSLSNKDLAQLSKADSQVESDLEASRKLTQIEFNKTVAEAKELPKELSQKIIADLMKLKAAGKIATPLEARLQKNKFLERRLTQEKGKTRAAQREAVRSRKVANNERMKDLFATSKRMPADIQRQMRLLHANYRASMPIDQAEAFLQEMKSLNEIGSAQNRVWNARRDSEVKQALSKMEGARKFQTDARVKTMYETLKNIDIQHTPADLVIRYMGDSVHTVLKDPIDAGQVKALDMQYKWNDSVTKMATELAIDDKALENINVYALWNQADKAGELGKQRLVKHGNVDPKKGEPTLTANEKKMYDFLRNMFDAEMYPQVKVVSENLDPQTVFDRRGAYWPNRFIGNNEEVRAQDEILGPGNVAHGFTKEVTGNANMMLETGPNLIFDHIEAVSKYVGMAQPVDRASRILRWHDADHNQPAVQILGNENVRWLQDKWLVLIKAGGQFPGESGEVVELANFMGKLAYDGVLLGRATTSMKQFLSSIELVAKVTSQYGIGAGLDVVRMTAKNLPAVLGEKWATDIAAEIEKNPELRNQVGIIELAQEDLKSKRGQMKTPLDYVPGFKRFLSAFIRNPDMVARLSGSISIRNTLMKKYNMPEAEAMRKSNEMVRTIFGSFLPKDRPVALGNRNTRPLYLFGVTELFRQGNYRQAITKLVRASEDVLKGRMSAKEYFKVFGGSSIIIGAFILSSFIGDYLSTLNIEDDDDREAAQKALFTGTNLLLTATTSAVPFGGSVKRSLQQSQPLAMVPFLGPISGVLTALSRATKAKTEETRKKNFEKAAYKMASVGGVPADSFKADWNLLNNLFGGIMQGKSDVQLQIAPSTLPELPDLPPLPKLPALPSLPSLSR